MGRGLKQTRGEGTDHVSDGIVKKKTYVTEPRPLGAAVAGRSLGGAEAGPARGIGGRRVLVTLIGDLAALAIVTLIALLLLPVASHLPIVGRSLAEFGAVRPPLAVVSLMIPWTIFVMYGYGLYRSSARSINGWVFSEGLRGLTALSVAAWSMLILTLAIAGSTDSLGFIAVFWACEVVAVPSCRAAARAAIWQSPRLSERTLIVGAGAVGHLLGEKIGKHPEYNLKLVGYLDDGEPFGATSRPCRSLGASRT